MSELASASLPISMFTFLDAGRITTVQGIPFRGHRHMGMPLAGAADPVSLALANWLVGNTPEAPAYEITLAPVTLQVHHAAHLAVAGAADYVLIDGERFSANRAFILSDKQTVEIPVPVKGCRSYLATCGGVPCDKLLDASSTFTPILHPSNRYVSDNYSPQGLTSNAQDPHWAERILPRDYQLSYGDNFLLRYVEGPEGHLLEEASKKALSAHNWTVSQRGSRMGIQLEGPELSLIKTDAMASSAVFPGIIQLPPSGQPFLLGVDAQTTGGYPRIAQIIRADRHLIGQLRPGARIQLQRVEPAEARRLYRSKLEILRKLQPDIRLD